MGSEVEIERLFEVSKEAFGAVDGLVNNAAINSPRHRSIEDYRFAEIMDILAVNTAGLLVCCREAVKRMSTKHGGKGGSIVNVSSIGALTGSPGRFIHYAGSKGAVNSITLGIAAEVVRDGIRVNAIRPGMVDTPIHAKTGDANRVAEFGAKTALGRAGRPEEVAEAILWLLSDKASFVTGAILNVMGAQRSTISARRPEQAAMEDRAHLRHLEFLRHMAERGIEDAALAVLALPHDRHHHALDPGRVLAGEGGRRQHLVRGIDVHVVLLGAVGEIVDPGHDRIVRPGDVDPVVDDVAGMGDPLAAGT